MGRIARTHESPWELLRRTAGGPRDWARKLGRLAYAASGYLDARRVNRRLRRLRDLGYIDAIPSRIQRLVGALDMTRFFLTPCATDYYRSKGLNVPFHMLLRVLDDPATMVDPTGLFSDTEAIIAHLLQVVHANPCYDLQLLDSIEGGLDELERQLVALEQGTHERQGSITAIVEDESYHPNLLAYLRRFRTDRNAPPILRENISDNPEFARMERMFGSIDRANRYFLSMPKGPVAALWHLLTVHVCPHLPELPPAPEHGAGSGSATSSCAA